MGLRERLRALRPAVAGIRRGADRGPGGESPWARDGARSGTRAASSAAIAGPLQFGEDVTLEPVPTAAGPVLVAETTYSAEHVHGRVPLAAALEVPEAGWRRLLPMAKAPFPVENALFVDLETTGLSRGAGTYAFLVGVGRFQDGAFRLRQFFMPDYDREPAVLEALRSELAVAEAIVTFNGRTFDWPLLETRATMNRLRLPLRPHLDLLPPARRVWRPVLGSARLVELEAGVLGVRREGDVPGRLIPGLYFEYLQTGAGALLADVFLHNRLDILSLAALVGFVGQAVAEPRRFHVADEPLSPAELFTIGRWLLPDGEGVRCLEESLYRGLSGALARQCRRLLADAYRREGRSEEAVQMWERIAAEDGFSPWACVELAKHYEHRARDLPLARQWTLRALELVQRRRALGRIAAVPNPSGRRSTAGGEPRGEFAPSTERNERRFGALADSGDRRFDQAGPPSDRRRPESGRRFDAQGDPEPRPDAPAGAPADPKRGIRPRADLEHPSPGHADPERRFGALSDSGDRRFDQAGPPSDRRRPESGGRFDAQGDPEPRPDAPAGAGRRFGKEHAELMHRLRRIERKLRAKATKAD